MSQPLTIEDRLILACARTEPDLTDIRELATQNPNWAVFLWKVERWGLATAVYGTVKKAAELPSAIAARLRALHHRDAISRLAHRARLRAILVRLSESGVPAIVPRPAADADLLVHERDRDEVTALVGCLANSSGWSGPFAIRSDLGSVAAAGIPIEDVWARARPEPIDWVAALVPSPEDVLLQLALDLATYLAKPDGSGRGVRTLYEVARACGPEGVPIDWRALVMQARDYGVAGPLVRAIHLARDLAGANVPPGALEALSTALPLADASNAAMACEAIFAGGFDSSDAAPALPDMSRDAVSRLGPGTSPDEVAIVGVTYDPATTDGVGSQLLRIYGLYALSRALHLKYVHTPIAHVGYQGFLPLLTGRSDPDFTSRFNAFFTLPSDDFDLDACERVRIHILSEEQVDDQRLRAAAIGRPVLLQAIHHYGYTDRHPAALHAVRAVSPYRACRATGLIRVCLHIRRGDNSVPGRTDIDQRLLPNDYYLRVCNTVVDALRRQGVPFVVRLHTEVPPGRYTLNPGMPGLYFRLDEPATVDPSGYRLDELETLPNLEWRVNVDAREALDDFATADVLILSRSSLGYVGGLLNPSGIVVYAPWWHPALPDWLVADDSGRLDPVRTGARIAQHLEHR